MRLRLGGSLSEYKAKIEMGEAQIHAFAQGFAITEVREYNHPREKVLNVLLLGGRQFDGWKETAHEKLKDFARVNGCSAIEFACRLGLEAKVTELGYRRRRVLMRYEMEQPCETREQESSAVPA